MATYSQNKQAIGDVLPQFLLDEFITWIQSNMSPDEVCTEEQLSEWAKNNGYVEEEK